MEIQVNRNPNPPIESFTITLTPREAVLLATLMGNQNAYNRMELINSYHKTKGILTPRIPNDLNCSCNLKESEALGQLYYTLTQFK